MGKARIKSNFIRHVGILLSNRKNTGTWILTDPSTCIFYFDVVSLKLSAINVWQNECQYQDNLLTSSFQFAGLLATPQNRI